MTFKQYQIVNNLVVLLRQFGADELVQTDFEGKHNNPDPAKLLGVALNAFQVLLEELSNTADKLERDLQITRGSLAAVCSKESDSNFNFEQLRYRKLAREALEANGWVRMESKSYNIEPKAQLLCGLIKVGFGPCVKEPNHDGKHEFVETYQCTAFIGTERCQRIKNHLEQCAVRSEIDPCKHTWTVYTNGLLACLHCKVLPTAEELRVFKTSEQNPR